MSNNDTTTTTESADTQDYEQDQDRRQLILPHVDTSTSVRGKTIREWSAYAPAGIGLIASGIALLTGALAVAGILFIISATVLVIAGVHMESELSEAWYLTPKGILRDYLSYRRMKRELPWGAEAAKLAFLHGVRCFMADGGVKRHDGSRSVLLAVDGTNTDGLPAHKSNEIARQLTSGIDEELAPTDQWWSFYSTTRPATSDPHASEREHRAEDYQNDLTADQRDIVADTAEWLRKQDKEAGANEVRHYVAVDVYPSDPSVSLPTQSVGARIRATRDRVRSLTSSVSSSVSSVGNGQEDTNDPEASVADETTQEEEPTSDADAETGTGTGTEPETETRREDMEPQPIDEELTERVECVKQAIGRVEGVGIERASPAEHIELLRSYWTGRGTEIGHASDGSAVEGGTGSLLARAFERDLDTTGTTPAERLLKPDGFDIDGTTVELGETYARTLWISEWPMRPGAMFLDELYTYDGVDLDVKVHAAPLDRYAAADAIENTGIDIGAEEISRQQQSDFSAFSLGSARELYEDAYKQLYNTNVSAWYLNGYVTVRAASEKGLNDACKQLRRRLEADPAGCHPVAPSTNQRAALASASPTGTDKYAEEAEDTRRHIALSGAFGAMFPFGVEDLAESDGLYWGRDTHTGRAIVGDPYSRGSSSHLFTIGKSRGGKSTFFKDRGTDWFLNGDDRTFLAADTESEFLGMTDVCGGEHIKIGSNDPINPLHIEPVSQARRQATPGKLDPLTTQINTLTELTMNIIRVGLPSQYVTVDPSLYKIARYGFGKTYERAGITSILSTHSKTSPVYDDFFDVLKDIHDNPGEHTLRGTDYEQKKRGKQAGELLENLIELMDDGMYDHLRVEKGRDVGTTPLVDDDVRMAYLDMPDLNGSSDAEKSVGLQLALSQISQKIKRAPGKTLFGVDEAHVLYQSEQMVEWLQSAARRWARYRAAMWSISQSPEEFVKQIASAGDNHENKRQTILEQSSTLQAFYCGDKASAETLDQYGMAAPQITATKNSLTPGRDADHAESLVQFDDKRGWLRSRIETSPVTDAIEAAERARSGGETEDETLPITEIEGIGLTYAERLEAHGVETPEDLFATDPQTVAAVTGAEGSRVDEWYVRAMRNGNGSENGAGEQPAIASGDD